MEQRAYTRIGKASQHDGAIDAEKVAEVAEVVATQVRLAEELGAEAIRTVATAAIREAANRDEVVAEIDRVAGVEVEVLSEHEEGRLAFIGATKTLGHPVEGEIGVVDVGGGSSEVVLGTVTDGRAAVQLVQDRLRARWPTTSSPTIRRRRPRSARCATHIADFFDGRRVRAARPGGRGRRQRDLAAHPGRRGARVRDAGAGGPGARPATRSPRSRSASSSTRAGCGSCPPGVLLLEKLSELLGQPLQIGKGGLREGVILDLLNGAANGAPRALAA